MLITNPVTYRWFCAAVFFTCLQVVASVMRYGTRAFVVKKMGWDDLASFITLLLALAYDVAILYILVTSDGRSVFFIPMDTIFIDVKLMFTGILVYGLATMSLKITLSIFLLKIFGINRRFRMIIYAVLVVTVVYGIFYFFYNLFQCGNPLHMVMVVLEQKCYSSSIVAGVSYAHACIQAATDLILATLPIFYLRKANMDRRTKISGGFILLLAFGGCVCTVIRIGWIHYLLNPRTDVFVTDGSIAVMSAAELSIGITCLALTTMKPLFKKNFFHRSDSSTTEEKNSPTIRYVPQPDTMDRYRRNRPSDLLNVDDDLEAAYPGTLDGGRSSEGELSATTTSNDETKLPEKAYWRATTRESESSDNAESSRDSESSEYKLEQYEKQPKAEVVSVPKSSSVTPSESVSRQQDLPSGLSLMHSNKPVVIPPHIQESWAAFSQQWCDWYERQNGNGNGSGVPTHRDLLETQGATSNSDNHQVWFGAGKSKETDFAKTMVNGL